MYPWIAKDIHESFHKLSWSKTIGKSNSLNPKILDHMKIVLLIISEVSFSTLVKGLSSHEIER